MNAMAFEYGDELIVVDCGVIFPDAELPGVDVVIPDITYLRENQDRLRAIVLTHGHEDHIGALPYVLDEVDAPVYGTPFTLALVRARLEEHGLAEDVELREMLPNVPFEVGPFRIEFIHLTHSIIDAGALAITTPLGTIIHTGDFKFDPTPTDQRVSDLHTLADYGRRGEGKSADLMLCHLSTPYADCGRSGQGTSPPTLLYWPQHVQEFGNRNGDGAASD